MSIWLINEPQVLAMNHARKYFLKNKGVSIPNKEVVVYIHSDQALIYKTKTDDRGVWGINHSQDVVELAPGLHSIYAVTIDPEAKVKSKPSIVSTFLVKKNFWVSVFNMLSLRTTIFTLGLISLTMIWLYRAKKKEEQIV